MKSKIRLLSFYLILTFIICFCLFLFLGKNGLFLGVFASTLFFLFAYMQADTFLLRLHKAEPLSDDFGLGLIQKIHLECERLSIPSPKLYLISDQFPLIFVLGRNPYSASMVISRGLLNILSSEELSAVFIQQLLFIKNKDLSLNTLAAGVGSFLLIPRIFKNYFGLLERRSLENKAEKKQITTILSMLSFWFLAPLASGIISILVSKNKDLIIDKKTLKLLPGPDYLANAINKVHNISIGSRPLFCSPGAGHLYFVNPFEGWKVFELFAKSSTAKERIKSIYRS